MISLGGHKYRLESKSLKRSNENNPSDESEMIAKTGSMSGRKVRRGLEGNQPSNLSDEGLPLFDIAPPSLSFLDQQREILRNQAEDAPWHRSQESENQHNIVISEALFDFDQSKQPTVKIAFEIPSHQPLPVLHNFSINPHKQMNVLCWRGTEEQENPLENNQMLTLALIDIFSRLHFAKKQGEEIASQTASELMTQYQELIETYPNFNAIARVCCVLPYNHSPAPRDLLEKIKDIYQQAYELQETTDAHILMTLLEIKYRKDLENRFSYLGKGQLHLPLRIDSSYDELINQALQVDEMSPKIMFIGLEDCQFPRHLFKKLAIASANQNDYQPLEKYLEESSFEEIVEINKESPYLPSPYYYLAKQEKNTELAESYFKKMILFYKGQAPAKYLIGFGEFYHNISAEQKRYQEAIFYYDEAIAKGWQPENILALELPARIKQTIGDFDGADPLYARIIAALNENTPPIIRASAAFNKFKLKEFDKADDEYEIAIAQFKANKEEVPPPVLLDAAKAKREKVLLSEQKYNWANDKLSEYRLKGVIDGQSEEVAKLNVRKMKNQVEADKIKAFNLYLSAFHFLGEEVLEQDLLDAVNLVNDVFSMYKEKAHVYNLYCESIERNDKRADGLIWLEAAKANKETGNFQRALTLYTQGLDYILTKNKHLDDVKNQHLIYAANLNEKYNRLDESERLWDEFMKRPHYDIRYPESHYLKAANIKVKQKKFEEAEKILDKLDCVQALVKLIPLKRPVHGELCDRANIELNQTNSEILKLAGSIKMEMKKYKEAEIIFDKVYKHLLYQSVYINVGYAYVKNQVGRFKQANKLYGSKGSGSVEFTSNAAQNKMLIRDYHGAVQFYNDMIRMKEASLNGILEDKFPLKSNTQRPPQRDALEVDPALVASVALAIKLDKYPGKQIIPLSKKEAKEADNHYQKIIDDNEHQKLSRSKQALFYWELGIIKETLGDLNSADTFYIISKYLFEKQGNVENDDEGEMTADIELLIDIARVKAKLGQYINADKLFNEILNKLGEKAQVETITEAASVKFKLEKWAESSNLYSKAMKMFDGKEPPKLRLNFLDARSKYIAQMLEENNALKAKAEEEEKAHRDQLEEEERAKLALIDKENQMEIE